MNWTQVEGKWDQFKGKVRTQWAKLTDDDLQNLSGKREQLTGALVERYGILKEQADSQVDEWLNRLDESNRSAKKDDRAS